jgi:hypothetical protein
MIIISLGACSSFYFILYVRHQMAILPLTSLELWQENAWGVGQILAPFAWAPLLIELGYGIVDSILGNEP